MKVKKVFIRNQFNYDTNEESDRTALACTDPSMARQSEKEESDINTIVKRFGITGEMPQGIRPIMYGDFEEVFDFQTAQNQIIEAKASFMALSSDIRKQFDHDPQQFMDFCTQIGEDGKLVNLEQMRKWKLALPEKLVEPEKVQKVEVVNPPAKG